MARGNDQESRQKRWRLYIPDCLLIAYFKEARSFLIVRKWARGRGIDRENKVMQARQQNLNLAQKKAKLSQVDTSFGD